MVDVTRRISLRVRIVPIASAALVRSYSAQKASGSTARKGIIKSRNVALICKHAGCASDPETEAATPPWRGLGALARLDNNYSETFNYRSAVVGDGFAPAWWRPMDLQEIYRGCWPEWVP